MQTLRALADVFHVSVSSCRGSITPWSAQWQPCRRLLQRLRRRRNLVDDFSSHSDHRFWTRVMLVHSFLL